VPKVNVYLPQWLADVVRATDVPVSEVCQSALAAFVGRTPVMSHPDVKADHAAPLQTVEERAHDLERAAAAIRFNLGDDRTVPLMIKPIGAATALAALKRADKSLIEWELRAQDVAAHAAAVEVAKELGAPRAALKVLEQKLAEARGALAAVKVSSQLGPRGEVLDLLAELTERAHPRPPR
jgi:hypothetical protein